MQLKRGDCVVIKLEERADAPGKYHSGAEVVSIDAEGAVWANHETTGMPLSTFVLSGKEGEGWRLANDHEKASVRRLREERREMRVKSSNGFWSRVCDNSACGSIITGPVWRNAQGFEFCKLECMRDLRPDERVNNMSKATAKGKKNVPHTKAAKSNTELFRSGTTKHAIYLVLTDYKVHPMADLNTVAENGGKTRALVGAMLQVLKSRNLLERTVNGVRLLKTPDPNAKNETPARTSAAAPAEKSAKQAPAPAKGKEKSTKTAAAAPAKGKKAAASAPAKKKVAAAPPKGKDAPKEASKKKVAAKTGNGKPAADTKKKVAAPKADKGKKALADHEAKSAAGQPPVASAPSVTVQ